MGIVIPSIGGFPSWELHLLGVILFISWFLLISFPVFIAKKWKQKNWMYLLILHAIFAIFLMPIEAGLIIPIVYLIFFHKKS